MSVRVTKETENGALELDLDALYSILTQEDLKDHHLAVVSIAGPLRTGKSFLMNFLISYMQQSGWKNPDWIGNDDTAAQNSMEWRPGRNAHTKGIIIWNEVFKFEKPGSNEKIAILLMDTQGLFDQTMTKEDNVKLFAWTMLLSSSIMLNIKSRIDERELEYLQFSVDYARAMKNSGQENKAFQDLLFLIRDWEHCDDDAYGIEGGRSYLIDFLAPSHRSELDEVRKNLRSSFETLECFLLPHPGTKVTQKDFKGYNRDISRDFLVYVEQLAEKVLHPVNIKKKNHHRNALTGHDLWTQLVYCSKAFKDGKLPTVDTMSVALAKARNEISLGNSLKTYNDAMSQIKDKEKLSDDELKSMHVSAQNAAIKQFEEQTEFGGEDIRVVYRERLVEDCQYALKKLRRLNDLHVRRARIFSQEKIHELWSVYREEMSKIDCCEPKELEEEHDRCRDKARRRYQVEAGAEVAHFKEHMEILEKDIVDSFTKIKQANEEKIILKNLAEAGLDTEYSVQLAMFELTQQYREEFSKYYFGNYKEFDFYESISKCVVPETMRLFLPVYIDEKELANNHRSLRDSYFDMFEKYVSQRCGELAPEYRAKFMKILDEECEDSVNVNERNKHHLTEIEEQSLESLKVKYTDIMDKALNDFYVPPEKLQASHDKLENELITELSEGCHSFDDKMMQDLKSRARENLMQPYRDVEVRNEQRKKYKPVVSDETWEKLLELAKTVGPMIVTSLLTIKKFTVQLNKHKSDIKGIVENIASIARVSPSTVVLAAGTVAACSAVCIIAYSVYEHYQVKNVD